MSESFRISDVSSSSSALPRREELASSTDNATCRNLPGSLSRERTEKPKTSPTLYTMVYDAVSHNPLGAGSYVFKKEFLKAVLLYLNLYPCKGNATRPRHLTIHIGAQPNNSPHAGTIITFSLGVILARKLKQTYSALRGIEGFELPPLKIGVSLDLVDTAPDSKQTFEKNGIAYQRSHRSTNTMSEFLPDYDELLQKLLQFTGGEIPYVVTRQADLLRSKFVPKVLEAILVDHVRMGGELAPEAGTLALRVACPVKGCSIAEKHGKLNKYSFPTGGVPTVTFNCLNHGPHTCSLSTTDIQKFEFNTPLRNLVRGVANMHLRVTGADYAGTYQEQLFYRQIHNGLLDTIMAASERPVVLPLPVIVYAPLLTDWSGVKLSKSLYVKDGAYDYLVDQGKDYLLSYSKMKERRKDPEVIFREVESWVEEPKKLFRNYSVEYFTRLFDPPPGVLANSSLSGGK